MLVLLLLIIFWSVIGVIISVFCSKQAKKYSGQFIDKVNDRKNKRY